MTAHGRSAHSGSAPDKGINALLALASAAQAVAGSQDPQGPQRLTAVPTVLHVGDAFNVVPGIGSSSATCAPTASKPSKASCRRCRPSSAARAWRRGSCASGRGWTRARPPRRCCAPRPSALGRPVIGAGRGGASDAAHFAATIPFTVDGLGPRGGGAHAPHEYVLASSLRPRAEIALAVADAALARLTGGRSERPYGEFLKEATTPPIYPLDCPGRFDQPNLCRTTTESGGPSGHFGGMGRIVAMSSDVARPFSREPDS